VALLAFSGSRTQLVAAVEGATSASRLLGVLQQAVNDHGGHLAAEQADANERVLAHLISGPVGSAELASCSYWIFGVLKQGFTVTGLWP
jgi:hypothetical protein